MIKRSLEFSISLLGLIVLSPLFLVTAILIKWDSPGTIFFKQERVGRKFRPFYIYKFRTMVADAPQKGGSITFGADSRITRVGKLLRKTKIDEIPQLLNVLKGDMSFVGPRPEVRQYVELFREDYREILEIKPGITDLASLKYRDEAAVLALSKNPQEEYVKRVLPDKIHLAKVYQQRSSLLFDIKLVARTVLKLCGWRMVNDTDRS